MSRIQVSRGVIPRLYKDVYELEIWYTGNGSDTFDPSVTTSQSTTVVWQTSDGQQAVTAGTSHNFSYTPASGGPYRCTVRVAGGLGLVTGIDCNTDSITALKNFDKCNLTSFIANGNSTFSVNLAMLSRTILTLWLYSGSSGYGTLDGSTSLVSVIITTGSPSFSCANLPATLQTCQLYSNPNGVAGSIAHLTVIRDLRINSMGWTAQQNTDVLLTAWNARASYTYASGILLRISAPTGTPGTEPPAVGESNSDWQWNAGTSRHDPLTGYAVKADLENDFYDEGFKSWSVTIA